MWVDGPLVHFASPEWMGKGAIPPRSTPLALPFADVDFFKPFVMTGAVERWLNELTVMQQDTLRSVLETSLESAVNWESERPRHFWLEDYPAQIVLVGTQIQWTEETQAALDELESGQEDAVKKYLGVCNDRLRDLINRVLGDLARDLRTKIIALITLDVHARDVVQRLIDVKAEGPGSFSECAADAFVVLGCCALSLSVALVCSLVAAAALLLAAGEPRCEHRHHGLPLQVLVRVPRQQRPPRHHAAHGPLLHYANARAPPHARRRARRPRRYGQD